MYRFIEAKLRKHGKNGWYGMCIWIRVLVYCVLITGQWLYLKQFQVITEINHFCPFSLLKML